MYVFVWTYSWFQSSINCLQSVRDRCPSSALVDDLIDSLLRPHLTLFDLCTRDKLYEGRPSVAYYMFSRRNLARHVYASNATHALALLLTMLAGQRTVRQLLSECLTVPTVRPSVGLSHSLSTPKRFKISKYTAHHTIKTDILIALVCAHTGQLVTSPLNWPRHLLSMKYVTRRCCVYRLRDISAVFSSSAHAL